MRFVRLLVTLLAFAGHSGALAADRRPSLDELLARVPSAATGAGSRITSGQKDLAQQIQEFGQAAVPRVIPFLESSRDEVRSFAGYILRDLAGLTEADLDALIAARRKGDVWIAPAIARVGTPRAIAFLIEDIKRAPETGTQMTWALTLAGEKAATAMAEVFAQGETPTDDLVWVLCNVYAQLGTKAKVSVSRLIEIAFDRRVSSSGRLGALRALGSIGESAAEAVPKLKELAQSEPGIFATVVGDAIVNTRVADGAPILAARLRAEPTIFMLQGILQDIASLRQNGRSAGQEVVALLKHESWSIRAAAARTLGFIDYREAVTELTRLLSNPEDWHLVYNAAESLGRLKATDSMAKLNEIAERHWFPVVRNAAHKAIGAIQGKESYTRLPSSQFGIEYADPAHAEFADPSWTQKHSPLFATETDVLEPAELGQITYPARGTTVSPSCGLRVGNNLLLGRYGGEWGGELVFRDENEKLHVLTQGNTKGLHRMPFGIVALHSSSISRVTVDANGSALVEAWRVLPGIAGKHGVLKNGNLYVSCSGGDIIVTPTGDIKMADATNVAGLIEIPLK